MVGDYQRCAVICMNGAAQLADSVLRVQQSLRREVSKSNDDFWPDYFELTNQVRCARIDLIRLRIAVCRRPVLNHVGYKDFLTRQLHGLENFCEKTTSRADKRKSGLVLIRPWSFSHYHHLCRRVPFSGHSVLCSCIQWAQSAGDNFLGDGFQRANCRNRSVEWPRFLDHRSLPRDRCRLCRRGGRWPLDFQPGLPERSAPIRTVRCPEQRVQITREKRVEDEIAVAHIPLLLDVPAKNVPVNQRGTR